MDITGNWAILVVVSVIGGVILALLRLIGLGIILIIIGVVFGIMTASQSAGAGILIFGILAIVGMLLIRLGVKMRKANK